MRRREKAKANKGRLLALFLGVLATATSFADRTANQGWVQENFVSRTNEWKLAERRHAPRSARRGRPETRGCWQDLFATEAQMPKLPQTEGLYGVEFRGAAVSDQSADKQTDRGPNDAALRRRRRPPAIWAKATSGPLRET